MKLHVFLDGAFCEGCGRVVDADGVSTCECGNVGNFTCGFFKGITLDASYMNGIFKSCTGRIIGETENATCRKSLCGEHVKLVTNPKAHSRETETIDMCEQCKSAWEPTPLTEAGK